MVVKTKKYLKKQISGKPKFEDCKNCLEATQHKNKVNHLEKNENDIDSLKQL